MKKILCMIAILGVIFITGCSKSGKYSELTFTEFQSKLDNKDSFVVVVGSSTCSACAKYKPIMEKVIGEKNIEVFYIDLQSLTDEEYSKLYSKYVITSTPTTIFIKDGLETSTYDRIIGTASYSEIVKNLQKHGFIGE